MSRVTVHIGTVKSGSTVLQNYFAANASVMADVGWHYPSFIPTPNHDCIPASLAEEGLAGQSYYAGLETAGGRSDMRRLLADEFSRHVLPGQEWLVSAEGFSTRIRGLGQIGRVQDFFSQWFDEQRVIVYFRRQDHMLVSLFSELHKRYYLQRKYERDSLEIDWPWIDRQIRRRTVDHLRVYEQWAAVFGPDNVIARPYLERFKSDQTSIIGDFHRAAGIPVSRDWDVPKHDRTNLGLSAEGIAFVRELTSRGMQFFDDPYAGSYPSAQAREIAAKLRPFVRPPATRAADPTARWQLREHELAWLDLDDAIVTAAAGPKQTPTAEVATQVQQRFAEPNRDLVALAGADTTWQEWLDQPAAPIAVDHAVELSNERFSEILAAVSECGSNQPESSKTANMAKRVLRRLRLG